MIPPAVLHRDIAVTLHSGFRGDVPAGFDAADQGRWSIRRSGFDAVAIV